MSGRKALSWPDAMDLYQAHLGARNSAARTLYIYRLELVRLRRYLERLRRSPAPAEVRLEHLRAYQAGLLSGETSASRRPLSVGTAHRATSALKGFFRWLTDEKRIQEDPSRRLELPRLPQPLPGEVLSLAEIARLLAAPDVTTSKGLRDRALLEVFYATGLRRGEALGLDLGDLDRRERVLYVRHGKGDKGRVVPLTGSAFEQVDAYLTHGRPALVSDHVDSARALFLSVHGRRPCEANVLRILRRHAQAARIEGLTPHVLRRSFATHLMRAGVSLRHIQVLLGHAKLTTTAVYLRLDTRDLRRELLLRHPREGLDA